MDVEELSNGGRAIIMETLEKYKKDEILMISDYEAAAKAISKIPVKPSRSGFNNKSEVNDCELIMEFGKEPTLE